MLTSLTLFGPAADEPQEIQYTNDILAMISPENENVSLGKVRIVG